MGTTVQLRLPHGPCRDKNSEHLALIHHWVEGETVNNAVGIKIAGGSVDDRTKIVLLDEDGMPPAVIRKSGGSAGPIRHAYEAVRSTDVRAGWIYAYTGPEPATES
ncbi:hypothetical protein [Streptomyces sp. NPDC058495]|uniref:hypothetical protein n=1 Tax=unclassified Streptomyces TaxID=2593676 RepID=UPI003667D959